jgi:hypothetical protein
MKKIIPLILCLFSNISYAQDWNAWSFTFTFKINTTETIRYTYNNFEVFLNDSYSYEEYQGSAVVLDSITRKFTLKVNYGCISCGYAKSNRPPEIYLKINVDENIYRGGKPFSTVIPIYFKKSDLWKNPDNLKEISIDLGTIDIKHFLTDSNWKDDIETYEIIEVISQQSIKYRKRGEYIPRRMNKMIKVSF